MRPVCAVLGFPLALSVMLGLIMPGLRLCAAPAAGAGAAAAAGWAEVEITPPLGIALGGRGGAQTAANKVLDPLYAHVLCLRDDHGKGFVLVSLDLIGLPHDLSDRLRARLVQELGVEWNLVVLNASHTHSGPYMLRSLMAGIDPAPRTEVDYFSALETKVIGAARAAGRAMRPVRVETFQGSARVGINRRGKNKQGQNAGMLPDMNGPRDDRVWVMKLTPEPGGPPAIVFSCACHAVITYGFDYAALSADFPGAARNLLREALGPKTHVQFVQGFAGDIRPRALADLENGRFRKATPADLEHAARELSGAVLAALKAPGEKLSLDLAGASDRPFLPRGQAPPRERYEKMRAAALAQTNAYRLAVADYWLKRYDSGEGFARGDAWPLGLIRLSENQWIVHCGGEPCTEWRAKMARWLAPLNIVTWGYSQEARSYLPTEAMLPEGGYEVLDSNQGRESTPAPFAPGIERAVRESLLRQLAFIRAGTP
ncbi:MAG TPA: hypothetical protein PKI20_10800 [Verrucomicrobiota bacterium]|nr:hypothetical protein [Verrucomicrobiota bacterium]HQL78736.1 hypothetical protein [Verrucomicrobiota bacterium]